ncbi:MAG: phenylalanine--tRNA ligase subunit beta, partial [Firmicutes bacterium]|nr:phenylalanine--tRNA ligase subunit beta [Bacillota bacterium]
MIVTLNWLKDFVDINLTPAELANKLTMAGFEVENITDLSQGLSQVFVGKITGITKHPNADKLQVCQIDFGAYKKQILTAATNVKVGQLVPAALDGAKLCNGVEIKSSVIRGIESQGMLCGGSEIGEEGDDGILVLKPGLAELGTPIADALGRNDCVFDIKVLANRPDCQSVMGLAYEIAAITGTGFKEPNLSYKTTETEKPLKVE